MVKAAFQTKNELTVKGCR